MCFNKEQVQRAAVHVATTQQLASSQEHLAYEISKAMPKLFVHGFRALVQCSLERQFVFQQTVLSRRAGVGIHAIAGLQPPCAGLGCTQQSTTAAATLLL